MNLKSKSFIALSSAVCLTVALSTGCNTAGRTPNQAGGTTQIGQNLGANPGTNNANMSTNITGVPGRNTSPGGINYQNGVNNPGGMQLNNLTNYPAGFDLQRADNIRRHLGNMPELNNANVIVKGNTAVIGYRLSNVGKNMNNIKNVVATRVKQFDTTITNVLATDTPNVMTEINKLAKDITGSNSLNDLTNRFNKLVSGTSNNKTK